MPPRARNRAGAARAPRAATPTATPTPIKPPPVPVPSPPLDVARALGLTASALPLAVTILLNRVKASTQRQYLTAWRRFVEYIDGPAAQNAEQLDLQLERFAEHTFESKGGVGRQT